MKSKNVKISVPAEQILETIAAKKMLKKCKIGLVEIARIFVNFCEIAGTKNPRKIQEIFVRGNSILRERQAQKSRKFQIAANEFLAAKSHLRERTKRDYRQIFSTIFRKNPRLRERFLSAISKDFAREIVEKSFPTARQKHNANTILHAFFEWAKRREFCQENPIFAENFPPPREREIVPLTLEEIARIFLVAMENFGGECVPAIALMLFAGIRPRELERLRWRDIDWEEKIVRIAPTHSKTGGCRHISILPPLEKILRERVLAGTPKSLSGTRICPKNWRRKWRKIREFSGFAGTRFWQQDVLRHTFASFHLKFFKNLPLLQCEMGHSSARLLRTRYLSMRGITAKSAEAFWHFCVPARWRSRVPAKNLLTECEIR